MLDTSPVLAHGPRLFALKLKASPPVMLRIAAFLLAVLLVLGALPAMRRADRAVAEGRPRLTVFYESARAMLAIAAAAAICLWLLSGL